MLRIVTVLENGTFRISYFFFTLFVAQRGVDELNITRPLSEPLKAFILNEERLEPLKCFLDVKLTLFSHLNLYLLNLVQKKGIFLFLGGIFARYKPFTL